MNRRNFLKTIFIAMLFTKEREASFENSERIFHDKMDKKFEISQGIGALSRYKRDVSQNIRVIPRKKEIMSEKSLLCIYKKPNTIILNWNHPLLKSFRD